MAGEQVQSKASEEQVRASVAASLGELAEYDPKVVTDEPGTLVVETGSVGMAYLAGGFRKAEKMPMRITLAMTSGGGGTGIAVNAEGRGTGGGISGGLLGIRKQKKAEQFWLDRVIASIPERVT